MRKIVEKNLRKSAFLKESASSACQAKNIQHEFIRRITTSWLC